MTVTTGVSSEVRKQPVNNMGRSWLDRFFKITAAGSTIGTEVRAGFITWLAMCYILFLNPTILGGKDHAGHTLGFTAVLTVTALVAGVMTLAMGFIGNAPLGLATGLGINAFVAYSLVGGPTHLLWKDAMGVIVVEGLLMTVLTLVNNIREKILNAIPKDLKHAIAVGIGLFIMFIGFVNAGVVVKGSGTPVAMTMQFRHWPQVIFLFGLVVTYALWTRGKKGALLYGIVLSTALAVVVNTADHFHDIKDGSARIPHAFPAPDFHLVGAFDITHFWSVLGTGTALAVVISVLMSDFFDNAGTTFGILDNVGMLNPDGTLPLARRRLGVDALAAVFGGVCSASSGTTYIESASGVEAGGRTGLTAVVTGLLFLASIVVAPVAGMVPAVATAPALVFVGWLMIRQIKHIDLQNPLVLGPAGLIAGFMAFTYSITNGIGAGFILYVLISIANGNYKKVHPAMYVVAAIFCWYFWHGIAG